MPYISDKDGGIITELRAQMGTLPVYFPGTGDGTGRAYWSEQINITGTGDQTVHTVPSGKRFRIDTLVLETQQAGAAIRLKSGAGQNISGVMRLLANTPFTVSHGENANLKGAYADNNFVINSSGDYMEPYLSGWVTGYDETT